jgi:hypothetical protein
VIIVRGIATVFAPEPSRNVDLHSIDTSASFQPGHSTAFIDAQR